MRLKGYLKSVFILGLILFLGVTSVVFGSTTVAHADETREIKLNVNSQNLVKGKSFSIYVYNLTENQTVTYRSTSPAVATVDKNGVVCKFDFQKTIQIEQRLKAICNGYKVQIDSQTIKYFIEYLIFVG